MENKKTLTKVEKAQYLFKSQLCENYMNTGVCKYGNFCQFAHGEAELQTRAAPKNFKTKLCRNYALSGHCPYGTKCTFLHDPTSEAAAANNKSFLPKNFEPEKLRTRPCLNYFKSGFCQYGNRCTFSHDIDRYGNQTRNKNSREVNCYLNFVNCPLVGKELLEELRAKENMYYERKEDFLCRRFPQQMKDDLYVEDPCVYYFKEK